MQNENPGPGTYKGHEQPSKELSPSYSKHGTGTFASKVQLCLEISGLLAIYLARKLSVLSHMVCRLALHHNFLMLTLSLVDD
jgi:hypothetical protein